MTIEALIEIRQPFDAAGMLGFLETRVMSGVEEVSGGLYRRSLSLAGGEAIAEAHPVADGIEVELWLSDPADREQALAALEHLFDADADPAAIDAVLAGEGLLAPLVAAVPGKRLPGCVDPCEIAVRAVLGQQVTVAAGITLGARLVAELGEPLRRPRGTVTHLFPDPGTIAVIDPAALAMPGSRKRALAAITGALAGGSLDLSPAADPQLARAEMLELPGVGPWTAEYVAMRALGDPDAFLATDLGVRRALERLGADGSPAGALDRAEAWRPWRAYAQQHLWASLGAASA